MQKIIFSTLGQKKILIYLFTLVGCFLVFKQSDLTHTYTSSYAFLNGHISDFYDYNKLHMGRNDYLPFLYLIFAIWNLPLKLLGLLPEVGYQPWVVTSAIEVAWSKFLLVVFFTASVLLLNIITKTIAKNSIYEKGDAGFLFATSPFVIFTVFIFSQYDIIGVFFTLLGFYFYLNRKFFYFSIFFSIAISFKYFAFIIYVPLILLIEKRILYLIGYVLIGWLFTFIQLALYWHSDVFINEIFSLAGGKTGEAIGRSSTIYLAMVYALICCYALFTKFPKAENDNTIWYSNAILLPVFAYALMFSMVRWHPHWIVILAPFTCLSFLLLKKKKLLAIMEIFAYIGFIIICFNTWERNVDITMAFDGVLGSLIPNTELIGRDILGRQFMGLSRTMFYLYLYSPILIFAYEKRDVLGQFFMQRTNAKNINTDGLNLHNLEALSNPYLFARAYVGTLFLGFILLLCIYWPLVRTIFTIP